MISGLQTLYLCGLDTKSTKYLFQHVSISNHFVNRAKCWVNKLNVIVVIIVHGIKFDTHRTTPYPKQK